MGKKIDFKLVGMSFRPAYPDNLHELRSIMEKAQADDIGWSDESDGPSIPAGPLPLGLYRDHENEYDDNAIEVHAPLLGKHSFVGFVPRELAAKVAPSVDRGDEWNAWLETVLVDPQHEDKPGALVVLECVSRAPAAS